MTDIHMLDLCWRVRCGWHWLVWAEAEEAGGRGGSEEGSRQKRRQQGRQADGEAGSSREGSEEGVY